MWHIFYIQQNNAERKHYVHNCHKRHQLFRNLPDPFNAAKQDQRDQSSKHDPNDQI